jgi:hypothetical protein
MMILVEMTRSASEWVGAIVAFGLVCVGAWVTLSMAVWDAHKKWRRTWGRRSTRR